MPVGAVKQSMLGDRDQICIMQSWHHLEPIKR
jgi:hypothetical protein